MCVCIYICIYIYIYRVDPNPNRSHTQTHDKNNTTNDNTKDHPPHFTTIEGGTATVRTTSHARVGGRVCFGLTLSLTGSRVLLARAPVLRRVSLFARTHNP